ncbi:DNA polymerase III subunit alpha [Iodobacter fluviatilis]|uniref:DNA polymerase III subunit alpha n=1 Tax=Iodobacter fluviatilis TaxID=537 RepID=A0A377Q918_9NEIS|nr:DNA polymerase III subunit alpha [Iodobacter fluviatilis]TCU88714.1 DNA polymerase III alpha subunit [Iodobacter fluviatilis]STQ91215.1 DNA polymerase III subunit alpha [Iodobacter fluviatilis]
MNSPSLLSDSVARYIHLRLHSEFSVTDGIVRLDDAVKAAKSGGMPALGVSDLMNLFGMVKHYKACREAGIKPIVGIDAWVENPEDRDVPFRILLICKSRAGYGRLCDLLSNAFRNNQYRGRAELKKEWLTEGDNSELICLSGASLGEIGQLLIGGQYDAALAATRWWADTFPDRFYLELQRTGFPGCEPSVQGHLDLASDLDLPVVATHPVQFMDRDDFKAHEARVCIAEGNMVSDKRRPRMFTEEQYFKSVSEMAELFADVPEALANSVAIAERCNLSVTLGKNYLPDFPTPDGMTLDDFLVFEAKRGLETRLQLLYPDEAKRDAERPRYLDRLKFETDTIVQMGFPGYFLIVADFIIWAKHNGCPVGPGRGSGAGSLVAYSLGITDIDPTAYALLFERFLNPERVSMPDFDIDFCQENRWRVIEYVREKYGVEAVSQIATFGTMAAKAVVRDVGRVLDLPYMFCDGLSKLIPAAPGKQYSLDDALEMEPILKQRVETEDEVKELWVLAKKLEGLTRNIGMHAGGVLIAPGKITDFCPIYLASGADSSPVSMLDKDDVEKIGLVKFDFLGLRNLTIIELALSYIRDMEGSAPDLMLLGFEDQAAYKIFRDANTTAVFQVESDGMKRLLAKLKPDRFEDIIAVLALYRPGPLGSGMVDTFINRKNKLEEVDYFHPDLTACLDPTYGVIVYQEQVMQISQIIGGYTLGGADMLRRAMGKKKPEEMAEHREKIAQGAALKGYDPKLAEQLFDLMAKFAEYGFNKSHTAAYAVVSYHTAWLKAHHCAAFMAATMSSELDNTDQLKVFYDDSVETNKLILLPPDVNQSFHKFVPVSRREIRYALGAIKGVGESAVQMIVREREANGPFTDLYDFCRRTEKREVNKRTLEALIRAGAFDLLDPHRARLLANVEQAMALAESEAANKNQSSLFDMLEAVDVPQVAMIEVPEWDERIKLAEEKNAVGFYISGHPFDAHAKGIRQFIKSSLERLEPSRTPQMITGIVSGLRIKNGDRGRMAFVTLDDGKSRRDVTVYSEVFEANRNKIKEDTLLVIEGKVSEDRFSGGLRIIADTIYDIAEARSRFARSMTLGMRQGMDAQRLKSLLSLHRGGECPVEVDYQNAEAACTLSLGESWRITLHDELLAELKSWLGNESVSVKF